MTTFSVRCWSGQLDRIKAAAEHECKGAPEWILERLIPATGDVLGDIPPLFPEIKRRPLSAPPPPHDTFVTLLANKLGLDTEELRTGLRAVVREAGLMPPVAVSRPSSISELRKAVSTQHR